jgi:hypothetical protein
VLLPAAWSLGCFYYLLRLSTIFADCSSDIYIILDLFVVLVYLLVSYDFFSVFVSETFGTIRFRCIFSSAIYVFFPTLFAILCRMRGFDIRWMLKDGISDLFL